MDKLAEELEKAGLPAALGRPSAWNAPELAKLAIQTLVPSVCMGALTTVVSGKFDKAQQGLLSQIQSKSSREMEQAQRQRTEEEQQRQRLVQQQARHGKRLWIWDQLAPDLQDIRCYVLALPECAELGPQEILLRKRHSDSIMSSYRDFLPEDFVKAYGAFTDAAFELSADPSLPIRLRASFVSRPPDKKKLVKPLFAYGKDLLAARAQQPVITAKWDALQQAVSQMFAPPP
ncbi:MAG: hypothetical protein U1A78_21150 [Polyangia bacterium]